MTHSLGAAKADLYALDLSNMTWLAAPRSDPADRLEVAFLPEGAVALRHSADPQGTVLFYDAQEWRAFLLGLADGEFDTDMGRVLTSARALLATAAGASAA
ncbi:DUF397 domain-containing protein [Kitasatospora sp. NPDC091335]|uniref:DUF397 domain-containing protein n=1 Tax=Kitasatospora sp. NPDC091335 TaxID=3364085 RepID=UPI003822AE9C